MLLFSMTKWPYVLIHINLRELPSLFVLNTFNDDHSGVNKEIYLLEMRELIRTTKPLRSTLSKQSN